MEPGAAPEGLGSSVPNGPVTLVVLSHPVTTVINVPEDVFPNTKSWRNAQFFPSRRFQDPKEEKQRFLCRCCGCLIDFLLPFFVQIFLSESIQSPEEGDLWKRGFF